LDADPPAQGVKIARRNTPIFPNLAKDVVLDGPDQLWVADITYVAVAVGFVYVAIILDAWSRCIVGYAISRSIDARLTIAAKTAAIEGRKPRPAACTIPTEGPNTPPSDIARRFLDRRVERY
jgi:putative transposase